MSCDTIKILKENVVKFQKYSSIFTTISPRARYIKEGINKWDYIKLKSLCIAKETSITMKKELTVWENIFANDTSDKDLFPFL